MSISHYQPNDFFRRVDKKLLKNYFIEMGILKDFDFDQATKRSNNPLFNAWCTLDEKIKRQTEIDFQEIHFLANEGGNNSLIDEAKIQGEDLIKFFQEHKIEGFYDRAFWVFLERKEQYWKNARTFSSADHISYWKKRNNLGHCPAKTDVSSLEELKNQISDFFFTYQGRGKDCEIEYLERIQDGQKKDYFFISSEDYTQVNLEWVSGIIERRSTRPTFEIIFIYDQEQGELDLHCLGIKKEQKLLFQKMFCQIILGIELPEENKQKVYNIEPLLDSNFLFTYSSHQSDIVDIHVTELFLSVSMGNSENISLRANTKNNRNAVYDMLEKIYEIYPKENVKICNVKIKAIFDDKRTRTFSISSLDSCNLGLTEKDAILKKVLIDSKIHLASS